MMRLKPFAAATALMLAGCTVGPDYREPPIDVPQNFTPPSAIGSAKQPKSKPSLTTASAPPVDLARWWEGLNDRQLDSLVSRAIEANLDLGIALTRVQEARTKVAGAVGQALPSVIASEGAGWGTGQDLTRGRVANPLRSGENGSGLDQVTQAVGVYTDWEIDLFGKFRREIEAARYDAEAAIAARNDVLISVVADVARAYLRLRAWQMRLAVARRSVATAGQTLAYVQARADRGLTNELDVNLAKRQLTTLEASLAPIGSEIDAARYSIAVLLGQYPGMLREELEPPATIPALPGKVDTGLPLDLLRRRPDIREAERNLAGATARIGVATANLFPHVSLIAAGGLQSPARVASSGFIGAVGPSVSWSILDFGTLDAMVGIADLRARGFLLNYKQTIIRAVEQVDTAMAHYAAQQDRLGNLDDALAASLGAVTLASERYERGLTDFLNVLDAQRAEFELEREYVIAQEAAAHHLVNLFKALGGGWEAHQSLPPIRQPRPVVVAAFQELLKPKESKP
jgi:NodT family efflux transporter outer membrane factor (OMF) lipoprotein